jgi:hypothetical protein
MLAFAALFALAAQHVVKAASGRTASVQPPRLSATVTSAKFFDEKSAFAFGTDPGLGAPAAPQSQSSPAPPVAQSSVS